MQRKESEIVGVYGKYSDARLNKLKNRTRINNSLEHKNSYLKIAYFYFCNCLAKEIKLNIIFFENLPMM